MQHFGIIAAMPSEAGCLSSIKQFQNPVKIQPNLSLIVSGMGAERAYKSAMKLSEAGANHLISWGTAAALNTELKPGDVILPNQLVADDGETVALSPISQLMNIEKQQSYRQSGLQIYQHDLIGVTQFLTSAEEKLALHNSSDAWAADMESIAIFKAAEEKQLAMHAIRVISDRVYDSVPMTVQNHVDEYGRPLFPDFYLSLLKRPKDIMPLIQLGFGFQQACKSLKSLSKLFIDTNP